MKLKKNYLKKKNILKIKISAIVGITAEAIRACSETCVRRLLRIFTVAVKKKEYKTLAQADR